MNKNKNATPLLIFVVISIILLLFVPAPEGFEDQPDPIQGDESVQGDDESDETVQGTPAEAPKLLLPSVAAAAPIISGPEPDRENIDMTPVSASPITIKPTGGKNVVVCIPASIKNT